MNGLLLVIGLSLGSALAFAVSTALKHTSARQVPQALAGGDRSLSRFVRATLAHPLWRTGVAVDAVGLTLQAIALHVGALALVQPLLLSGLVFALLIRLPTAGAVSRSQLGWAAVLVLAMTGVLTLAGATTSTAKSVSAIAVFLAGGAGVLVAAASVAFGRRHNARRIAGPVLGVAVALAYAGAAALLKAVADLIARDPISVVTSWQLYALIAVGAAGLLLNQMALQSGPLTASLPTISALDPLFSIGLGVLIYHEHLRLGVSRDCGLVVLLALLIAAILHLAPASQGNRGGQQLERIRAGALAAEARALITR